MGWGWVWVLRSWLSAPALRAGVSRADRGGASEDPMLVFNVTDQVRETIQQTLYSLLVQRESVFR